MNQVHDHKAELEKQLQQLMQLEQVLDSEKQILVQNEPEKLTALSEQKNALLIAIQEQDKLFAQSPSFKTEKAAGNFKEQLELIENSLLRCKDKNLINGQIIQQSQIAVERMKTGLLQQHNKASMTYDAKGKTSGGLSSLGIKA